MKILAIAVSILAGFALSTSTAFGSGFTETEKAKLGRCLDTKKRDAAACKSECYGAFGPTETDDKGRNLRDLCSLACKYKAFDECCERLKIDCNR